MSIQFHEQCNYVFEAKSLLARYFNQESIYELHDALKKRAGYNQNVQQTLEVLETVYDEIMAQVVIDERIAMYFKGFSEEDNFTCSLADCMLHQAMGTNAIDDEKLEQFIISKFRESDSIFIDSVLGRDEDQSIGEAQFMKELAKQSMDDAHKWNVWNVYKNFEEHIAILLPTITKCIPVIKKVYAKYHHKFNDFYAYWQQSCIDHTFEDKLKDLMNLNLATSQNLYVQPTWMNCNSIRLFSESYESNEMQMQIGLIFFNDYARDETLFTKEEICTRLKLLSDTSKYEILKLVKKEKMYGSQLAQALSLTTATISHHISSLTSKGLLSIEKDANRVYYQMNKKQVGIILDQLRKDLLEE